MFWVLKEPSHPDGSFEYPQHMFWMRNKENRFPMETCSNEHKQQMIFGGIRKLAIWIILLSSGMTYIVHEWTPERKSSM